MLEPSPPPGQISELKAAVTSITRDVAELAKQVAVLAALVERHAEICPFREKIGKVNGIEKTAADAKQMAQDNRVKMAEYMGAGGLGGIIVLAGQLLLHFLK